MSGNMYYKQLILIVALAFCLILSACEKSERVKLSGTLETGNDSIYYQVDQYSGGFTFSEIEPYDTINNELEVNFSLFTDIDTITFSPDTTPRYVKIISGDSSTILTITYFNLSKQNSGKNLNLLKEYAAFSQAQTSLDFQFIYALSDDENLTELRQTYNLDSVAGNGDELSRIINLLNWANKIVQHDGSEDSADPKPRNALNIIETCNKESKGVNCRMMATLLNEAYLATGFKSRHITCLPNDKEDADCHVINIVYSESFNKWLYVDPTFAAYFMDPDSNLMSIEEVRQGLINEDELLLPDEMNWNGAPKNKRAYRNYMTKNLFRFFCPVNSEFGYESKTERAWVYLNPTGYDTEQNGTADTTINDKNTFIDYYTEDNKTFWTLP